MPAFSKAMAAWVVPSLSVCSSSIVVMQVTAGAQALVESRRPPSPTSSTATSTRASRNKSSAAAVVASKKLGASAPSRSASDVGAQLVDGVGQRVARYLAAGDAKPLRPALEVRRGEGAHAEPGLAQQRLAEQRRRALPFGARDVHDAQRALRIPDAREQRAHGGEREASRSKAALALEIDQALEIALGAAQPVRHWTMYFFHCR